LFWLFEFVWCDIFVFGIGCGEGCVGCDELWGWCIDLLVGLDFDGLVVVVIDVVG